MPLPAPPPLRACAAKLNPDDTVYCTANRRGLGYPMMRSLAQSHAVTLCFWVAAHTQTNHTPYGYCTLTRTASGRFTAQARDAPVVRICDLLVAAVLCALTRPPEAECRTLRCGVGRTPARARSPRDDARLGGADRHDDRLGYGTGPLYPVRVRHWPATPFSRNRTWCVSSHRCGAACCALRLCKRFMEYSKWVIEYAAV